VLIDGKSVFYRGYYAMPNLSTKDGIPTGGVFGFATLSLEVIKRLEPDYVAVAWDKPKTNIRKRLEIYPEYKAGRKPAPADFYAQIPILHELLEALGWPLYELDDYEADDIMAGLAKKAAAQGIETVLVTSDLDALQCVDELVKVYVLKKGISNIEEYHPESFTEKYGLRTDQFLDLKALKGDSSDNIPGVPGIGEKTATTLLQQYETLDGIYENIDLISGGVHDKLVAGKDSAYMSREIARLYLDAPLELDLKATDVKKFDAPHLKGMLEKLEFRSLIRQMPALEGVQSTHSPDVIELPKLPMVKLTNFAWQKQLTILGFFTDIHNSTSHGFIVSNGKQITIIDAPDKEITTLKDKLEGCEITGFDTKRVVSYLLQHGITTSVVHDVKVAAFVINSLHKSFDLDVVATQELGTELLPLQDIPPEDIGVYAIELIGAVAELTKRQKEQLLKTGKLESVVQSMEWPIIPILAKMENEGIELDVAYLQVMQRELEDAISDLEQTIYGYAGREFNISSPQQLAEILFDELNLPTRGIKKGKTGYSTAASELSKLVAYHPIIPVISEYREHTKLKSTYVDTLPLQVGKDGRLHTTFHLTIAQTGRLSSTDPNLQNIPVRSELGKKIRHAFIAKQGHSFISADYSQFELRLAAVLAGDVDMIEAFNSGADIHTRTAAEVYGVALDDVTSEMRSNAKTINFGVLYGMSPHGLSVATGMTMGDAKEFIDKYFAARQPLVSYIEGLKKQAKDEGFVETLLGRRRPTPDVKASNFIVRMGAERQAVNMPIQGTEADLMKLAMIKLEAVLPASAKQLLQIHDSILVEVLDSDVGTVADLMKDTMENIFPSLGINLRVDVKTGKHWGEL
jgi:DNA polymerase-1